MWSITTSCDTGESYAPAEVGASAFLRKPRAGPCLTSSSSSSASDDEEDGDDDLTHSIGRHWSACGRAPHPLADGRFVIPS